ncbi:MAG: PTS system mannose/fructose/sorbose family transporter subunit IID [Gemmatimonadota bacterium]|nr:PTS system mannose/fructose/sorbose family transporter subunit IID [Gemmatimonadota bacterium]
MIPRGRDLLRAWARTFAVQGSWNYRTMIAGGVTFALLPLLRRIHAGDPVALAAALARHLRPFNAHPYLSGLAVGALARAELEGVPPERLERFREALHGPLGSVGDRAVWATWRPVCLLAAIAAWAIGVPALAAAGGFLVVYNAGHLWLRAWGFRTGWQAGLAVGGRMRGGILERVPARLAPLTPFLLGLVTVLLTGRFGGPPVGVGVATDPLVGLALPAVAVAALAAFAAHRRPGLLGRTAIGWVILAVVAPWLFAAGGA